MTKDEWIAKARQQLEIAAMLLELDAEEFQSPRSLADWTLIQRQRGADATRGQVTLLRSLALAEIIE